MAAALLLGNLALVVDASSPRAAMAADRAAGVCGGSGKSRHAELSMSRVPKRDPAAAPLAAHAMTFRDHADAGDEPAAAAAAAAARRMAHRRRRGASSKVAAAAGSPGTGGDGDDGDDDWKKDLRSQLKELEEMKEIEKRAAELVAEGAGGDEEETEEEKRERVRRELERFTKELAERRKTAKLMFELGQKAYGKGRYSRAVEFLEAALTIIPRPTLLGGEIQIWLAMAYEANNRHKDCIALYQQLENQHPSFSIRRQAAELRYILQAPKIKITKEEMITIPSFGSSYDCYANTWSGKYKDLEQRRKTTNTNQLSPSELAKNRTFWLIVTMWFGLIGTAILLQR